MVNSFVAILLFTVLPYRVVYDVCLCCIVQPSLVNIATTMCDECEDLLQHRRIPLVIGKCSQGFVIFACDITTITYSNSNGHIVNGLIMVSIMMTITHAEMMKLCDLCCAYMYMFNVIIQHKTAPLYQMTSTVPNVANLFVQNKS